jgi:2-keto-4-pentenoate hydratase
MTWKNGERMMDKIEQYAQELFEAEQSRKAVSPFTARDPSFSVDEAYAVQTRNVARAQALGHRISGKKIGLTSFAMQRQLGVGEPDYGHLFAAMDCGDGAIDTGALIQPKIEAELAFVLRKGLGGGHVTEADVVDATAYVSAAFEIVDSRVADWRIKLADTVADNASTGRYVLGPARIEPGSVDLAAVSMKLYKIDGSGELLVAEGEGADVMGNPLAAVAWLANKLWAYGVSLNPGEVVLSGALSAAPAARRGDAFRAEFSGFGTVEASFR